MSAQITFKEGGKNHIKVVESAEDIDRLIGSQTSGFIKVFKFVKHEDAPPGTTEEEYICADGIRSFKNLGQKR